jgi:hypothetical protein
MFRIPYVALVALLLAATALDGQEPSTSPCDHARAGYPLAVSRWAIPSDTGSYVGYLVGGGNPFCRCAEPPYRDEGTFGWDYRGWLFPRRVILGWWHGRYQGGTGTYRTDGAHIILHEEGKHD